MKTVYLVERNGSLVASEQEFQSEATAFLNLERVEIWKEITPKRFLEVERCVPYVSTDDLEAVTSMDELRTLLQVAKLGVPSKPHKVLPIPKKIKEGETIYLYKGKYRRQGNVRLSTQGKVSTLYIGWTEIPPIRESLSGAELESYFPAPLSANTIAVENFLCLMESSGAYFDGVSTYRLPL